jgi:hypothetical protein
MVTGGPCAARCRTCQCQGVLLLGHVDEQNYEYVFCFPGHVWQHAGCLAASVARDMLHAMMLQVRTFVLPRALYACQVWGPDMLQLSPCDQSSLLSELLSFCNHVLWLRGSVAQVPLVEGVNLQT